MLPLYLLGQKYPYYHFPDQREHDSLERVFDGITSDTAKMAAYHEFAFYFSESKRDSALYFLDQQLALARKFGLKLWEADALDNSAYMLWRLGNYPEALRRFLEGIDIAKDSAYEKTYWNLERFTLNHNPRTARRIVLAQLYFDLATLYEKAGYSEKESAALLEGEKVGLENKDKSALSQIYELMGSYYLRRHQTDTALMYLQKSKSLSEQSDFKLMEGDCLYYMGNAYLIKQDFAAANKYFLESIKINEEQNSYVGLTHDYLALAGLMERENIRDSAFYFAKKAMALNTITKDLSDKVAVYDMLSSVFKLRNNMDSAYAYQIMAGSARDSLNSADKVKQFDNVGFTEQFRVQQLEAEKVVVQNKIRTFAMLGGLGVVLLVAILLYRNNRQKQKTNIVLASTLAELKSTQSQLIQSEKMASLGELTAGIAHEIQNPLNFVNNFSDLNTELLTEMNEEISKGNYDEVKSLAKNLTSNEEKINHHGRRADAIVKSMLQHSRSGAGKKETANINALADEYLRLAYHGIRARDHSFNASMKTNFDDSLPDIHIVPQDIGRVLLNLYTNAFYAVSEREKQGIEGYDPTVTVSIRKTDHQIEIRVGDNGNGMSDKIKEKIFQPFFTTKPTGQGTGLGLSLSYDIIRAHGGELNVKTTEGEGSEFIIRIPVS